MRILCSWGRRDGKIHVKSVPDMLRAE